MSVNSLGFVSGGCVVGVDVVMVVKKKKTK